MGMRAAELVPLETISAIHGRNFFERAELNPCVGCMAPCCRMLLIPHPTPTTYMDLDYILYMLGFPSIQMLLSSDGGWQILIEDTCRFLDQKTSLCRVHNTPRKPQTCVAYNPYQCWYKRNFSKRETSQDSIRINMNAIETILQNVRFDEDGNILEIPSWESIREMVKNTLQQQTDPTHTHMEELASTEAAA